MRVLHTINSLQPSTGGPARSVPGLCAALVAAGVDVHLWAKNIPSDFLEPSGVKMHTGQLEAVISASDSRPDLLHDHGVWLRSNHLVSKLGRRFRIRRVVSPRGMLEPWALAHRRWKKKIAWWLYQCADLQSAAALHATADSEALQFRRLGLRAPVHVIPNGIQMPEFVESNVSPDGLRTALFLGRVHKKKGLPLLVEAWSRLRPTGWKMKVVGPDEGGHCSEVRAMVEKCGLADSWEFSGPVNDSEKWENYAGAQIFILPSHSENFGIVVAEALASGVPVITTNGCPWEGLRTHKCGWWTECSAEGLSGALQEALSLSPQALGEMGDRGKKWIREEFGWNKIAAKMVSLYESALKA